MSAPGKLYLVSVGPGFSELIAPMAVAALKQSDAVVSYDLYLRWVQEWIQGKEVHTLPLTKEKERALKALEWARMGRTVSLVSSGDIGIYAMATLAFEEMREDDTFEVAVVPGVSAANSCASLLGAPLSHDFATLSLSDLLCPWEWIEERARHLAQADMAVALYNVQSRQRQEGAYRILRIFLESKSPETWCGVVRNAYREDQETFICTLGELLERKFDMLTTLIVGNRFTRKKRGFIYTPRGYNAWGPPSGPAPEASGAPEAPEAPEERGTVWVFSGTSDGNTLAQAVAEAGHSVTVSAATEYGREQALESHPGLRVRAGRMGVEARRLELRRTGARAIVDATHPFAVEISQQLMGLAQELSLPYLRYERPGTPVDPRAVICSDIHDAARRAAAIGGRVFLATGSKDLPVFLQGAGAEACEWFARVTPDPASLQRALALGIPRARICAMQGPFSREVNEALWRTWGITCVITKESGAAGGFPEKLEAAAALGIPILVVQRPALEYPAVYHDAPAVLSALQNALDS